FNNAGRSAEPNPTACVTIAGGPGGIPAAPSGLTATYNATKRWVNLTWTDNSNNETSFEVLRRFQKPGTTVWTGYQSLKTLSANTTVHMDSSGLNTGYVYGYVVRASNSAGSSGFSNESTVQIPMGLALLCAGVSTLSGNGPASYGYAEGAGTNAKWGAPVA